MRSEKYSEYIILYPSPSPAEKRGSLPIFLQERCLGTKLVNTHINFVPTILVCGSFHADGKGKYIVMCLTRI